MSALSAYWPSLQEINNCIKSEAETASDAVLLAVHQPSPLSVREARSDIKQSTNEKELLASFLTPELPEGTLVTAITGGSGTGKSHIIRWLAAELKRDPRAKDMHVIRIPKSANLKTVVELILEPLKNNPKFDLARSELHEAVASVKSEDAAIRFSAELRLALKEKCNELISLLKADPKGPNAQAIREQIPHAQKLPDFLSDPALNDHFDGDVLPKIVERAVKGRQVDTNDTEQLPQFSTTDLQLPDSIPIQEASQGVQNYYLSILNRNNGVEYTKATNLLNSVVEIAIRNVFRLNQAMGGITLEEIVLNIRAALLEEGKELVLLIEDFAALSGIQETLLHVCIQEAVRDGKIIRSPMRTALAVTDGYLASRETILTRAGKEWIVESTLSDPDDVIERSIELTASYLNAARWGEQELQAAFKNQTIDSGEELTNWAGIYINENDTPESSEIREKFGESSNGVPLFPFNRYAISELVREKLTVGGTLEYNPRAIIKNVIRQVLLLKEQFTNDEFPSSISFSRKLKVDIAHWLDQVSLSKEEKARYSQVIAYWGGNPEKTEQLSFISDSIFQAFELTPISKLGIEQKEAPVANISIEAAQNTSDTKKVSDKHEQEVAEWKVALENWVDGERLKQTNAAKIRNLIASHLKGSIDWNAYCMRPPEVLAHKVIYLPNDLGNPQEMVEITKDPSDANGRLRRAIIALIRFDVNKRSLNYKEADEDTAIIADFIEELTPKYLEIFQSRLIKEVECLTTALVIQSIVLGLSPKVVGSKASLSETLFKRVAVEKKKSIQDQSSVFDRWQQLVEDSIAYRRELQALLKERVCAFQATGTKPMGVDITRLSYDSNSVIKRENLPSTIGQSLREYISNLSVKKLQILCSQITRSLEQQIILIEKVLGENCDKVETCKSIKGLADLAENCGVWPAGFDGTKRAFSNRVDEFQKMPVADQLNQLKNLISTSGDTNSLESLHFLGKIDLTTMGQIVEHVKRFASFVEGVEKELENKEKNFAEDNYLETVTEMQNALFNAKQETSILLERGN